MKAMITGANGQLGLALVRTCPVEHQLVVMPSDRLNICDSNAVRAAVREHSPDIIVNAAAYTRVDAAESDSSAADEVNHAGVTHLSAEAQLTGAKLLHISTDFVFDGQSSIPYRPSDPVSPINAYGRSKRAGEIAAGPSALIVRTAWVYSHTGSNFLLTMLRIMKENTTIRVVDDQIGSPTNADSLATALWGLASSKRTGIMHYTDSGVASWYDFAVAIFEEARAVGILRKDVNIVPIATEEYPTPAARPRYSVLDKRDTIAALGRVPPHWRENLRKELKVIAAHG